MPMQTFFNLPEDKRKTILRAARQEFSRVPLEQASVANIIKTANIPRGSFYQYFYNKEDLYSFMLRTMGTKMSEVMSSLLKENNGDIIETYIKFFEIFLATVKKDESAAFYKNVFTNINDKMKESLTHPGEGQECHHGHMSPLKMLIKEIDLSNLALNNEKELLYVLRMMQGCIFQNLVPFFSGKFTEEEAVEGFVFQMNIIRRAIYKSS